MKAINDEQIAQIKALHIKAHKNYRESSVTWLCDRAYGEYQAYCRVLAILGVEPLPAGMSES